MYAIYLRKSRADAEAEARGEGETLARHQNILLDLAKRKNLDIGAIYKELVSGETIAARPEVQKLLEEVSAGKWDGVICMEVERLARGDTIDQGIVAQAFKCSNTLIVTPSKTYDPSNEYDEEYFEFNLFMSRREYKTIRRRMTAGRIASVREGNYIGSIAPYGYKKTQLPDKSFTLEPEPQEAEIVKLIFDLYIEQHMGASKIATYLNSIGAAPRKSESWDASSVRPILSNPVYCGFVRWNTRPIIKAYANGKYINTRPRSAKGEVHKGKHEPIISEEMWNKANDIMQSHKQQQNPFDKPLQSQYAKLMFCGLCGRAMVRRPYKNKPAMYMCVNKSCGCMASDEDDITDLVMHSIADHLVDIENMINGNVKPNSKDKKAETARKVLTNEIEMLNKRKKKLYDFLEREVYTEEMFAERFADITKRIADRQAALDKLPKEKADIDLYEYSMEIKSVLDTYSKNNPAEENNELLSRIIRKINYTKTEGGRWKPSNLKIDVEYKM